MFINGRGVAKLVWRKPTRNSCPCDRSSRSAAAAGSMSTPWSPGKQSIVVAERHSVCLQVTHLLDKKLCHRPLVGIPIQIWTSCNGQ